MGGDSGKQVRRHSPLAGQRVIPRYYRQSRDAPRQAAIYSSRDLARAE
jgi:hypothetical protein